MPTRPTDLPTWATNAGTTTDPGSGAKATGWLVGQVPPAKWFNYLFNVICRWIGFFNAPIGTGSAAAIDASSSSTTDAAALIGRGDSVATQTTGLIGYGGGLTDSGQAHASRGSGLIGVGNGAGGTPSAGVSGYGAAGNVVGVYGKGALAGNGGSFTGGTTGSGVIASAGGSTKNGIVGVDSNTDPSAFDATLVRVGVAGGATGTGVFGNGTSGGLGVFGQSDSGPGGQFQSTSGIGAKAVGNGTHAALQMVPQSAPSSPGGGETWFDSSDLAIKYHDGTSALRVAKTVGRVESQGSSTAVTTTSVTGITPASVSIPANLAKAKDTVIRVHYCLALTRAVTGTFFLYLTAGGSTATTASVFVSSGSSGGSIWGYFDVMFDTVGASASMTVTGGVLGFDPAIGPSTVTGSLSTGGSLNTTGSWTLGLSAQFSVANAANAVLLRKMYVELL